MRVGVPKETATGEARVAVVPDVLARLAGIDVVVERGAGTAAGFDDAAYADAGAQLADDSWSAVELVAKVARPTEAEEQKLADGQLLIAFLQPLTDRAGIDRLAARGVTAFAMESIPRITRAQSMDALSSQATVAGYKAALLAADHLPKFFPMLTTAAGTIAPAKVLVLGAGVAGLQALATARRLGAVVSGFDVRPVVREQIESLGAQRRGAARTPRPRRRAPARLGRRDHRRHVRDTEGGSGVSRRLDGGDQGAEAPAWPALERT